MKHDGAFPEQHHRGTARAVSFLSFVFHLKKSRREDIIKQRPCSPVPNNAVPNPFCSRLACRPYCVSLTEAPCAGEQSSCTSSWETSMCCGGTPACPKGQSPASPTLCALLRGCWHIAAQRTLPAAGAGSRAGTEQRQVPLGIKPHSQLWLHMLPHQHQPLVTNWLCCPEREVGVRTRV